MKRLLLLRHAKSSWDDPRLADFDRPLNERGRRAAPLVGRFMHERGVRPDLVLASPAARARHTAALVAAILNAGFMVRHYARGARGRLQRAERTQAIQHMGLAVREAFNRSEDFEPLLAAVVDGLRPRDEPPF